MGVSPEEKKEAAPLYPLFVRLEGARVVVVGAGKVAARKIEALLNHGASLTVIAPDAVEEIRLLADEGRLHLMQREYEYGDLEGALFAVAATSDSSVNEAVFAESKERAMLVNVVDVPELCNCFVPSSLRRGRLQIAVSTEGASPTVARELRCELEEQFPSWWEPYLDLVAKVRSLVKERIPGPASERVPFLEELGSSALRDRFASGERPTVEEVFAEIMGESCEKATSAFASGGARP